MPTSEVDALANMMGADSRRIDGLVHDMGSVKGKVEAISSDVARAVTGIDDLREALTVMVKHQMVMERLDANAKDTTGKVEGIDQRVQAIERQMPGLLETRAWMVRAMLGLLGIVGVAVVSLVVKVQAVL